MPVDDKTHPSRPKGDDTRPVFVGRLTDTQPVKPNFDPPLSGGDTRPYIPAQRVRRGGWVLWGIAGFVGVVAVALAGLVLVSIDFIPGDQSIYRVTLIVEGTSLRLTTTAETVGEVLDAQNITRDEDTVVQPEPAATLTDGMTITVEQARRVTLTVDGLTSVFRTVLDNPSEILDSAGVEITAADDVTVDGTTLDVTQLADWPLPANRIVVRKAVPVTIAVDSETVIIQTTAGTVGDALLEADVALFLGDTVTPPIDAPISEATTIMVERSQPVTVEADGTTLETRSQAQTVGEVLVELGVALNGLDYSVPPENARVSPGLSIRVVRVTEQVLTEDVSVPFETVYQADANLELDQTQVLQGGVPGVDEARTRVRYENGVEVRRTDEGLVRVQEPVNQVIAYGTNIVLRSIDTPDGPRQYWRTLRMIATSYHPAALGGDNITSIGRTLTKGIVAIDPGIVSYNTMLYVPGYGVGEAADTGGPRSTRYWIDLGYDDENYEPWARWVDVYLLTPVPDDVQYLLP